jgi:ABC-type polar amino acid transport system ATPase subunit
MILKVTELGKKIDKKWLFKDVSFGIEKGHVLALCGPSGSGKTTLVRIVSGLVEFDEGKITVRDVSVDPRKVYPKRLYGKIGVVFQEHNLFPHMTAQQNIELSLRRVKKLSKNEAVDRSILELEKIGLGSKAKQYPNSLSGGERQRIAIARSLAVDPLILMLDEPTSGLDPSLIGEVLRIIRRLAESGTTMLLITHNIKFAKQTGNHYAVIKNNSIKLSDDPSLLDCMNDGSW